MKQELLHHVKNQSNVRNLSGFGLFNGMAKSLKFALLSLVFILLGFVFGTQDVQAETYPASQTVYVESSTDYGTVKLYAWGGTYSNPGWCGETMTSLGLIGSNYYWSITLNGTFTNMIVCDNSCTKISGNTDGEATDGTETNCITVTGSSYSWKLFNCTSYSDCPSNVLTGTNVMFYINQSYGGTLGITNNSSSSCIANGTNLGNNNAYINMAKASVPDTMSVSNNCGGWVGTGAFSRSTAYNAGNYFVTGDSKSNTSATTASLSASSTSIAAGTSSINITSTAGSVNSSFGKKLAIQYYISTTKYGCDFANTSGVATTINTSSLSQGTYKIKSVLTDGTIYYLGDSINLYVTPSPFTFGTINRTSCTTANLAWSANAPALLVRYEGSSPSITNPTHGQSYSSGNTIGAGTVVYSGTSDNYTATFDADKIYTFVIYRVSASGYLYSTSASTTLPKGVPALTTATATSVGGTVATLGGNISSKGAGGSIKSRGIEWTATVGGKTAGNREEIDKTDDTGAFSKSFTGLTGSTTYKYKAYATNNSCESSYGYGAEESFTTSTSCSTPTSGFAASANPSTVYISNTAYAEVTLSTSQTADAYQWECVSHPSYGIYNTPTIVSSTASSTTVQLPIEGTYTFRVGAKCTADEAYTYSETVTVTANLNLWMKGPLFQNTWGDPTNVAWSISNNVRTYTLNPAYYNTGNQPREFVLNAYEGSDDSHHIHSSTTSSGNQLTLTGIEYYNSYNLKALESLFSEADKNLKLTVTHQGGVYYDITLSDLCTTPTSGFAASGTYNSGDWTTRFTNDHRSATLSTEQLADAYLWECTSANSSKVSIASNTSKSTTATFDLPGEYTFRVGAKCTADSVYTYSQTVTVNVPYPEIGISGPFYDGDGNWNHPKAGTDGKFSRSGLVYTKDFTVKASNGEFVIIQAYKLGCEENNGWAGYQECNGDGKGNKINCSTLSTSTINTNTSSCGNFTQSASVGLSNGQTARLTVTMTAYDSYTMLLELACTLVEITPSSGEMLLDSITTFSTSVSGASGTPTYKWYVNNVEQSGQTSSTFDFTPTVAGSYAVKVEVTGDCTGSATANMTTCNSPTISSLIVSSDTTTPWEPVIITATVANTDNVVFTATGATIIATQNSSTEWEGRFKAGTVKTYEVTATATSSSSTCGSDTETVEIDVEADVEVCP